MGEAEEETEGFGLVYPGIGKPGVDHDVFNEADKYAKGAMESAQSNQRFDSVWDALDIDPEENYTPPWDHRALDKAVSRFYNLAKESK